MSHWLLDNISKKRASALKTAEKIQIYKELIQQEIPDDLFEIYDVANALELAVLDLILGRFEEDEKKLELMRECAADAFKLLSILPLPEEPIGASYQLLRMSSLAVLGDRGIDASRLLKQIEWPALPFDSNDWGKCTWSTITDIWLRLIRKKGWEDRDLVLQRVADLRSQQEQYEKTYLNNIGSEYAKTAALELIGLYHLAKAAEIMALFITDGVVEGNYQIRQLLETHFDRALAVCEHARMLELEPITRLISASAMQMVENSIWTVTRAVNTKVTQFVRTLVDKGRGDKALFDVLPPQRRTLAEKGLLGSSRRAVVVSLPTSSGKTMIAQFRILQALNQFEHEQGWVAYLAPTRALVNQITRQLRSDFASLEIVVEKVSPALDVDSVEMALLTEKSENQKFRVLVTTPEKLDLMLRQGWEVKIGRPLTLVVVDEAHNIQSIHRGLKLELLLATINKECINAQFLLLTPFINNAREVARWLGGTNSDDISLAIDWQPNDRTVGIIRAIKDKPINGRSHDYALNFETVHTTRKTINTDDLILIPKAADIAKTYSKANKQGIIAAIAAQFFKERGPVIIMHSRPDWVWALSKHLMIESNREVQIHPDVKLLQDYLKLELGKQFPLIELLNYGIAVHHSGLPEEVRTLVEWLFENSHLKFLVATTTIAQGINFPVSGVVMASHQYFSPQGAEDMPPEDFWNIAGRTGRVSQGQLGVVALVTDDEKKGEKLKEFINNQTDDLNSALVQLALEAGDKLSDLEKIVYSKPEWSSFLQYLAHTYQQMGKPESYFQQIEQVLRGTFGFEKLRTAHNQIAQSLLSGIEAYTHYLQEPGQPLKLVDSTGFSLQAVKTVLTHKGNIDEKSWNSETLYAFGDTTLQDMMGILLRVPELRDNLKAVTGGIQSDGDKLALILKDWVGGASISEIAIRHFQEDGSDDVAAITKCGQNLFGKLTQTVSWGLGALLAITGNALDEDSLKKLSNLPAMAFYGVNSDEAIIFRLLGVPRTAASFIANQLQEHIAKPLPELRNRLLILSEADWNRAIGENGKIYRKVWRILEGLES